MKWKGTDRENSFKSSSDKGLVSRIYETNQQTKKHFFQFNIKKADNLIEYKQRLKTFGLRKYGLQISMWKDVHHLWYQGNANQN